MSDLGFDDGPLDGTRLARLEHNGTSPIWIDGVLIYGPRTEQETD